MTTKEIAEVLNNCGNKKCSKCKYICTGTNAMCRDMLIEEMADELEKVGEYEQQNN